MNRPTQHHYVASVGYDTTGPISTILWSSLPSTSPSHQLLPSPSSPSSSPSTHPLHGVISASAASFDCSFSGCSQGVNPIAIVRNAIVSIQACQGGNSNTSIYTQDALRQRRGRLPHSIRIVCWKCLASSIRRYGMGILPLPKHQLKMQQSNGGRGRLNGQWNGRGTTDAGEANEFN